MNDHPPKTTGLQISLILIAVLAMALGVTAYLLYKENQELKEKLEQHNLPQARLVGRSACELVSLGQQFDCDALNPDGFLFVPCTERYN